MAIEGLKSPDTAAIPVVDVNVGDRAALALEALRVVDRIGADPEATLESIRSEFGQLTAGQDFVGETYVRVPFGQGFTPLNMIEAVDGATYSGNREYPKTYPVEEDGHNYSRRLWLPQDPDREGYSIAEINRLSAVAEGSEEQPVRAAHARVALAGGPNDNEPLLHLLGLPYDEMYAEKGQATQLGELADQKAEFEGTNPYLELDTIDLSGFLMLALQRRIEGKPTPFTWGFMRIPQLGRKTVGGGSVVGDVYSGGDQLRLGGSYGHARPYGGVGFSVGQKELEPQAS